MRADRGHGRAACGTNPDHQVLPRSDVARRSTFFWDMRVPAVLDVWPHRCYTCKRGGLDQACYFSATAADIEHAIAGARVIQTPRDGMMAVSPAFLFHVLQLPHEEYLRPGSPRRASGLRVGVARRGRASGSRVGIALSCILRLHHGFNCDPKNIAGGGRPAILLPFTSRF